jgi:PKD repeat protein
MPSISAPRTLSAILSVLTLASVASAQIATTYSFTQQPGTYTPITGGTQLGVVTGSTGAVSLDDVVYPISLPFPFFYNGVTHTSGHLSSNGFWTFGATTPGPTNYAPLSSTIAYDGAISAFGRDLQGGFAFTCDRLTGTPTLNNVSTLGPVQVGDFIAGTGIPAGTTIVAIAGNTITMSANATSTGTNGVAAGFGPWSEIRTETLGTTPNRVFVMQWTNFRRFGAVLGTSVGMLLNFQIQLHEAGGRIEVVYGDCTPGVTTFTTVNQVGLRGTTNNFATDVNNRLNVKGTNDDWLQSAAGTTNASGMLFNNVAPANVISNGLTYTWQPQPLVASFAADVTSGPSPLSVQFTDQSLSQAPGGITSWAWDFDGDNIIDSTLQNPAFVYTSCGSFNVSLTVTDGVNPPVTTTRNAFIRTDNIVANFTSQLIAPLTVQFTDTSNMPATSWSWDLDGDGISDSNAQNPVWVYPNTLPVNVSLTVSRLCSAPSTITRTVRAAQEVSHNVAANNGLSSGASVYFDLDVLNIRGLSISSMDVIGSVANTPFTVEMWVKPGTHVGFEGTAAEWVLTGIASGTTVGNTTGTSAATFPQAIYLPPGLHGVKLRYLGVGPRYQNLTVTTTVGNADVTMTVGVSRGSTVADPWAGANIALRAFSGSLFYGTHNLTGLAGFGQFAPGCAGTLPRATVTGNLPQLGQTYTASVDNLPISVGIMMIGFSNTASAFGPLPLSLTTFGAAGCFGRVSPDATSLLLGAGNTANWTFPVPNNSALSGLTLFQQVLVLDAAANAGGFVTSNAAAFQIGN